MLSLFSSAVFVFSHLSMAVLGFLVGGLVMKYYLIKKFQDNVSEMFNFGDAGALIDELMEVDNGE